MAGDGIRFVQETEKLTFPEAVEALAERFGIPVRYASGGGPDPEMRSLRQALLDIHDYATDHFHRQLMAEEGPGEAVRRYWTGDRGFSLDLAREFRIGLSPPEDPGLMRILLDKGFKPKALASSGLFHTGRDMSDPTRWFPVFRGRLMIPIRDLQGQVVAFTARQLDMTPRDHASWKAKYINSPETPLFKKSRLLFNLDRARDVVREAGRMVLVEGQLDALRCWDCGLGEAVAPQGTSVTEEQLAHVKRYTDRLDVFMDSDAAGVRAVLRLIPMAFRQRLQVRVIGLPEGEDPDDFLRENGLAGMDRLEAQSSIQFAGKALLGADPPSPEKQASVLNELFKILRECPSAVVREGYFREAVAVTKVSLSAALQDYRELSRNGSDGGFRGSDSRKDLPDRGTNPREALTNLEGDLLWAVLQNVALAEPLAQVLDHQWINSNTSEGKVLTAILNQTEVDQIEQPDSIYFLLETDEERNCFHEYSVQERGPIDLQAFVNETIASLVRRFCRNRSREIEMEINRIASKTSDPSALRELIREKTQLRQYLAGTDFPRVVIPDTAN